MGEKSFNFPDQFQWGRNHLTFQTNSNGEEILQLSRPIPMGEILFIEKNPISNDMSSLIEKKNKKAMVVTLHLLQDIQSIMRDWGLMDYNIFY
jgi:hypothetical protein